MRGGRFLSGMVLAGWVCSAFATDPRVLTMGRSDDFFMDDISIYRNPANVNVYPNMLLGELGIYKYDPSLDSSKNAALARYNRDPQRPFFGGILSYSLNQSADAGNQYPMLSIGAVLNRHDAMLDYIDPTSPDYAGTDAKGLLNDATHKSVLKMLAPVGKIDLLVGYALKNGAMLGVGGYLAFQKSSDAAAVVNYESSLYKVNIGMNWPITKTMDLEVSAGGAQLTGKGKIIDSSRVSNASPWTADPSQDETVADHDLSYRADVRLFSALTVLNGDFVPRFGFDLRNLENDSKQILNVNGGLGINLNIDRGFFWAGLEGLYSSSSVSLSDSSWERLGGKVSFGIERNVLWDWFVWRIGGTKALWYEKTGENAGLWGENPEADASDNDLIGFGLGLNIENRLKIDGVVAEDVFYTFSNLFSGNEAHLMTRLAATYSF
jgi:hypothetical protein